VALGVSSYGLSAASLAPSVHSGTFSTDVPPARHWQHLTYGLLWDVAEN